MWKVHVSLTPPPPLLYVSLSHLLPRRCVCPSRLLHPLFFLRLFFRDPPSSLSSFLPLILFLSYCSGWSASLSRLLFNSSTLRSIAILLYLLAQSPCSLVDRSSLLVFEKAVFLTPKAELLRTRDTCNDSSLAGTSLSRLQISRVIDIYSNPSDERRRLMFTSESCYFHER